jgi:hypothetical protein
MGFLCSFRARAAACVWSRGYINGLGGWICRRLASLVACGVSTAAVDPATLWDESGCPPLAPSSCEPPGELLCPTARAGELQASWTLLCPTAHAWQLRASWRRPTARAWQLQGSRLWLIGRSWQLGASWLRPCSLLSPRGWHASKLCPCELALRLQTLQPVKVKGQVVVAGPGHSDLVVRKSADAGVVNWKK